MEDTLPFCGCLTEWCPVADPGAKKTLKASRVVAYFQLHDTFRTVMRVASNLKQRVSRPSAKVTKRPNLVRRMHFSRMNMHRGPGTRIGDEPTGQTTRYQKHLKAFLLVTLTISSCHQRKEDRARKRKTRQRPKSQKIKLVSHHASADPGELD